MVQVVAIDGPVAVGKSSVARLAAAELGLRHINTGANGTGKLGSLAQPAGDGVRTAVRMTAEDMRAMQVRINARINTGNR